MKNNHTSFITIYKTSTILRWLFYIFCIYNVILLSDWLYELMFSYKPPDIKRKNKKQMNYNFDENEMPYDILERFGLTQAMIDDLPTDVLQNIHNGRKSPVLPVHITADDGEEVKARTRFSLVRTVKGGVDVLFYPQLDEFGLKLFNELQEKNLLAGKPIVGHLESNEVGNELGIKCFFQLDLKANKYLAYPHLSSAETSNM